MRYGIIIVILLQGAAFGQTKEVQPPAANLTLFSVGKWPVKTDEFIYLFRKNHTKPEEYTEEKVNEYLNLFINFKLKIAEARTRGLDTTRTFIKEFNSYKDELKKPYNAGADDLDRLTREAYDRLGVEVRAAHMLIMVKPDASPEDTLAAYRKIGDLRQRAVQGEDFNKLAKEYSEDPSAKVNGGNLGYFTALQMVYPFEDAAYKTSVGEISSIIRTRFGYHILKVAERRPAQGEVEVSHILLRNSKGNEAKTRNAIFEIYDQLKGGRKWDDLVKEYSEDLNTKNTGGRLKPFGVGALASVPEFEQMAFSLKTPGEFSDPFQSNIGWHIVRLERKIPLEPYKNMEASLKRRVARDERLSVSRQHTLETRKKEAGFEEDTAVKTSVMALADSSLIKGTWKHPDLKSATALQTLFTLHDQKIPVRDFFVFISVNDAKSTLSPTAYMKQLHDQFIEEKIDGAEEKKMLNENPDFRMLLNEYKEGILLFSVMEKEVWNRASEDSSGQRKFYNEHPEQFKAGNRVEARIFTTTDKSFLEEIKNKIAAGDTLSETEMRKFKSVTNWKAYERAESPIIDRVNWVPGVQDVESGGIYYLVEVSRLLAPGKKAFEESKAAIISGYQELLEKEWLKTLRQKYPVRINKKGKKSVVETLKK